MKLSYLIGVIIFTIDLYLNDFIIHFKYYIGNNDNDDNDNYYIYRYNNSAHFHQLGYISCPLGFKPYLTILKPLTYIFKSFNKKILNIQNITNYNKIKSLYVDGNTKIYLDEILILPINLIDLNCYNNKLTKLPILPISLRFLDCSNNILNNLPILPMCLIKLNCNINKINKINKFYMLKYFTKKIIIFNIENNPIKFIYNEKIYFCIIYKTSKISPSH